MDKNKKFFLPVGRELTEVTSDIYSAYYQSRRYFKYKAEQETHNGVFSYNAMDTNDTLGEEMIVDSFTPSTEERILAQELHDLLQCSICALPEEDQKLIYAIFYDDMTQEEYAKKLEISQPAVCKRLQKILIKLRKMLTI